MIDYNDIPAYELGFLASFNRSNKRLTSIGYHMVETLINKKLIKVQEMAGGRSDLYVAEITDMGIEVAALHKL